MGDPPMTPDLVKHLAKTQAKTLAKAGSLGRGLRLFPLLAMGVWLVGAVSPVGAAEHAIVLDPEETTIRFTLGATGHDVEGSLVLQQGELRIDPEKGLASGRLEIDARRSETGNAKRDKTMQTKVFEIEHHPLITFTAESFEGGLPAMGKGEAKIHGKLTLVGGEHPMTLPLTFEIESGRFDATTQFPVPFVEWGLHDPSIFFLRVEKVVQVEVHAMGQVSQGATNIPASGDE